MKKNTLLAFLTSLIFLSCTSLAQENSKVKTGAEILIEYHLAELEGRKIGLVMNPTARIGNVHVLDTLLNLDIDIRALYSPEHGFRGEFSDGEIIQDGVDQQTGLPVYSLYGSTKKPTREMLKEVDLLLFDMQDVGARFYTFNSTMRYVIEAASEYGIEVWILDRPNPAGGEYVSGWMLEAEFESMVGSHFTPVAHGMTLGELAKMGIGEDWYELTSEPNIRIIEMKGWKREMLWPETGLTWYPPSPNLPTFQHAYVYLGTCFIEGTTVSEGRGTDHPFLTIGAPDYILNQEKVGSLSQRYSVEINPIEFTPISIPGKSTYPKYQDVALNGLTLSITDHFDDPVRFGVELTNHFLKSSESAEYRDYMNLLAGYESTANDSLIINWQVAVDEFELRRSTYLLYD